MQWRKQRWLIAVACIMLVCMGTAAFLHAKVPAQETAESGILGMVLIDIPDDEAAAFYHVDHLGVYVLAVDEKSQAYEASVRSGDRIVSINGFQVSSTSEFVRQYDLITGGGYMELCFQRGTDQEKVRVSLALD